MRRIRSFFIRIILAGVLLGIPAGLVYVQVAGLPPEWRERLAGALSGPEFRVAIEKLTFHPFEGIVAEGVSVFRRDGAGGQVAVIDRLAVSPNLADLFRGKFTVDALAVDHAALRIPFAEDGRQPDAIPLEDLSAEIVRSPGQVRISRAEFVFQGIRINLHGMLLRPDDLEMRKSEAPENPEKRVAAIRSILRVVEDLEFRGAQPVMDVEIAGDLSDLATLRADRITFRSGPVRTRELAFERVSLDASYASRRVEITLLALAGESGNLRVSGWWETDESSGALDVSGSADVDAVLEMAGQTGLRREVHFREAPEIAAAVTVTPGPGGADVKVVGSISAGSFRVKDVKGERLSGDFAWQGGRLYAQDVVVRIRSGEVRLSVLSAPGDFRMKLTSDAIPGELVSLFGPKEREIIDAMEFKDAPRVALALEGPKPDFKSLTGTGRIELGRTAMRGSWIDFGKANLIFADRAVRYDDITLGKGEQRGTGSFTYDFGRQQVRLDGVRCDLMPVDVLMWVDPRVAATVSAYRFRGPPDVTANGTLHMKNPSQNALEIGVDAGAGMEYDLLGRTLRFGGTAATVSVRGQEVIADVSRAALYGGEVSVEARVSTDPAKPVFRTRVAVDRMDFPSLTKLYFGYERSQGVLSGNYAFAARLRDEGSMTGRGSIRIEDGHVLAIPVFGPLSEIISAIIPGAGHESARLARADFTIADREITTRNLEVEGAGFTLFGDGKIAFPSGAMDMGVRINAKGISGIVLFPVSKLFEYVSTGTLSKPDWRPKIIPKEFLDVLGVGGGSREPPGRKR